jgi:cold-inducible RNA-binding protein
MRTRRSRGNLFVGNLPPDFTDERLAETFDPCGIVLSATVARDPATGKNLRYGFVDIATERAAEAAVAAMKGVKVDGYPLDVSLSKRPAAKKPPARPRFAPRPPAAEADPEMAEQFSPRPRRAPGFQVERRRLPPRF